MFLETAIQAARLSGKILMDNLPEKQQLQIDRKQPFDFVTQVDHLSENAIMDFIRNRHPRHNIMAEESGGQPPSTGYSWLIDPLDGTTNFIHEFPMFAVSIGLLYEHKVITGVVFDPVRNEMFHAEKHRGAYLNGRPIKVSNTRDFSRCLLATGFPFRAKHLTDSYFEAFKQLFHQVSDFRRAGAAALDLAYLASGRLDGFWELTLNPWDIAAGTLLIEEAGGQVTDLWGGDSHLSRGHIVASNGFIHNKITQIVGAVFSDLPSSSI
ncbi:MAG: inositol monophosphatase family protein [bacterium]